MPFSSAYVELMTKFKQGIFFLRCTVKRRKRSLLLSFSPLFQTPLYSVMHSRCIYWGAIRSRLHIQYEIYKNKTEISRNVVINRSGVAAIALCELKALTPLSSALSKSGCHFWDSLWSREGRKTRSVTTPPTLSLHWPRTNVQNYLIGCVNRRLFH